MNKIFIFDFDGVICDSTNECMINSYNSWEFLNKNNNYQYLVSNIPLKYKNKFKIIRPYVKGAGEYFVANKFIENENIKSCRYWIRNHGKWDSSSFMQCKCACHIVGSYNRNI